MLKIKISPNGQLVKLGDGCTTLAANGEIDISFSRDKWTVRFRAIVVEKLNSDIYGGMTFLTDNGITLRAKTGELKLHNKHIVLQTNTMMLPPQIKSMHVKPETVHLPKVQLHPKSLHVFPADQSAEDHKLMQPISKIKIPVPEEYKNEDFVFITPRYSNNLDDWPPEQICQVKNNQITIENETDQIISIPKDVAVVNLVKTASVPLEDISFESLHCENRVSKSNKSLLSINQGLENAKNIDISRVPSQLQEKVKKAHIQYSDVFSPDLTVGYNGFSGQHFVSLQFADDNRPKMNKCHIPKWAGKHDVVKQKKMDQLEEQGVLVDPYQHKIPIKMISPSFLRVKARAKGKDLEQCELSELRWIISPSQLNPFLRQLETKNITKEDLFVFKSNKPYCVEFDLFEGYFQNHILKRDWSYLAVETPFKGLRVLTRSGQGLLNQEIEMNNLLAKVLGQEITKGNVIIQADDGQVGGKTIEETIDNWIKTLDLCSKNNIKLNYKKIKILPDQSLIHGWVFKDGHVQPDPHRKLALLDMKKPKTIGEMRTYMGVYKTFFPAMPRLSNLMSPFEKLCGGKESKDKIDWSEELEFQFTESQKIAQKDIKTLALPRPDEQLFIVPDAACRDMASKEPALGFILFVHRETGAEPVMFVSWKMGADYWKWSPCDLEGLGASIAVDKCAFFILRSTKPTLVFPDNKQVLQAFNKLKKGRYSTSQRLATFTNRMQKYPIIMQHGSGRLLQNIGSDYISRNAADCKNEDCSMCEFAKERGEGLLATILPANNGTVLNLDKISQWTHANISNIPIGNLKAWLTLQENDPVLSKAIKHRKSGQHIMKKGRDAKEIKHYSDY